MIKHEEHFSCVLKLSQFNTDGLGFFICFIIWILLAQNNKRRFFYLLYSDKTWAFDQSERLQGRIYIIIFNNIPIKLA